MLFDFLGDDLLSPENKEEISVEQLSITDPVVEAKILLEGIRAESTEDEFEALMESTKDELILYGLIPSEDDIATEATKKIVKIENWKEANFKRIYGRTIVELAKAANDSLYPKYKKACLMKKQIRAAWEKKYGAKARTEAKKILKKAKTKSSNMSSAGGKSITKKIDSQLKKLDKSGRNNKAINK